MVRRSASTSTSGDAVLRVKGAIEGSTSARSASGHAHLWSAQKGDCSNLRMQRWLGHSKKVLLALPSQDLISAQWSSLKPTGCNLNIGLWHWQPHHNPNRARQPDAYPSALQWSRSTSMTFRSLMTSSAQCPVMRFYLLGHGYLVITLGKDSQRSAGTRTGYWQRTRRSVLSLASIEHHASGTNKLLPFPHGHDSMDKTLAG